MMIKRFILFIFSFLMIALIQAQPAFDLKVSDKKIGKADQVQVEYEVNNAASVGNLQTPDFTGWNVVSGPEYSQQSVSVNGKVSSSVSSIFILSPKKTGTVNVPGASIMADGKTLTCTSVAIEVSTKDHLALSQQAPPPVPFPSFFDDTQSENFSENTVLKKGEDPAEKIRKNIFVKVTANKTSCYIGEPILVTYQLFSALDEEAKINRQPTFSGCSVIELTNQNEQMTLQKIGDKTFRVSTIRKVQLIPLQTGELKMDTAVVDNTVNFSSPENPYQTQAFSASLPSNPLTINVKPLPEKNKPDNFSGVVGKFTISAKADSTSIAAGENNVLEIKIEGEGNFAGIEQPPVLWSKNFQAFEGTDTQHVDKTQFPMSGDITFEIPFIINKQGRDTIDSISFTFFNPETGNYETVHTDKISLLATAPIPRSQKLKEVVENDLSNKNYLWIVAVLAVIVIAVFVFSSKHKKSIPLKKYVEEEKPVVKNSSAPEENIIKVKTDYKQELQLLQNENESREFFSRAKNILVLALQEKTQEPSNSASVLLSALPKYISDEDVIADAQNIYKVCNYSLYTPDVSEEEKILLQARLELLIKKLEV